MKKKPKFVRQGAHRKKRVKKKGWRRPRGMDSKQKKQKRYMSALPTVGYRKSKGSRGLHPCGLLEVRIFNVKDLDKLDPKMHTIRISANVGNKKKIEILKTAEAKRFKVLNKKIFEKIVKKKTMKEAKGKTKEPKKGKEKKDAEEKTEKIEK